LVDVQNRQDSYARVMVGENSVSLKIEMVNDVGFRVGEPVVTSLGFKIDTWENILSNKLTALQRQAGKDFVDILFICLEHNFNWETMIGYARQKDAWINEITVSEFLFSFDLLALKDVKFQEHFDTKRIDPDWFKIMARESVQGLDNSLSKVKL
jgi:hypothetical protein